MKLIACSMLAVMLSACSIVPSPAPTATATATDTATPSPTATPTSTATHTPTATYTSRPTATATRTSAPSSTPTSTPRPVTPQPTATPKPAAHVFAETPIEPFNPDRFIPDIQRLRDVLETIKQSVAFANPRCNLHLQRRKELWALLGFDDVPAEWLGVYVEYRSIILQTYTLYEPILAVCAAGGGTVESSVLDNLSIYLDSARPQVEQLLGKAYQVPRP